MTRLEFGQNPVIRELPVVRMGKNLIVEIHPTILVYREKGKKKPLFTRPHAVVVAMRNSFDGLKAEPEEKEG